MTRLETTHPYNGSEVIAEDEHDCKCSIHMQLPAFHVVGRIYHVIDLYAINTVASYLRVCIYSVTYNNAV